METSNLLPLLAAFAGLVLLGACIYALLRPRKRKVKGGQIPTPSDRDSGH
jgi:hypothetical protein